MQKLRSGEVMPSVFPRRAGPGRRFGLACYHSDVPDKKIPAVWASLIVGLGLVGCRKASAPVPVPPQIVCDQASAQATAHWLDANAAAYRSALARARSWLDALPLDVRELDKKNLPGKRKLGEMLTGYKYLGAVADPEQRRQLEQRVRALAGITQQPWYHDLLTVDDARFKRDSTSYLLVASRLEDWGLDISRYREEIKRVHSRLNQHMMSRGNHQQLAFHNYYVHFGLAEPYDLRQAATVGVIADRMSPFKMKDADVYSLTHEVFGRAQPEDVATRVPFSADELTYLRWALDRLTVHQTIAHNLDLLSELLICIFSLGMSDLPITHEALASLLENQNANGSWGQYEEARATYGEFTDQAMVLHTTSVAIYALTEAFGVERARADFKARAEPAIPARGEAGPSPGPHRPR